MSIPPEPIPQIAIGLFFIFLAVLILPFRVRKIEENLEPFFLLMGILSVTISGLWSFELIKEALTAPVSIGRLPIGIFQVVLIAGLVIYRYNEQICKGLVKIMNRIGIKIFIFVMITVFGLISSIISVIVTAVILSEIITVIPIDRNEKIKLTVISCFAVGLGAALTPVGEPLSTIVVSKLKGEPYHADFFFLFNLLAIYIIPGILALAILGSRVAKISLHEQVISMPKYTETLRAVIARAVRVYVFVSALVLLGNGFTPLIVWYFTKIPPLVLYWVNMVSAILDNATLAAAEIGPKLSLIQIKSALLGLLVSGGMLIPGNIPNIVCAGRLKIKSKEWAKIGVPLGLVLMSAYFIAIVVEMYATL